MKKISGLISITLTCFIGLLFLVSIENIAYKVDNKDTYVFNVKQTAKTTNDSIVKFLSQESAPIHLDFQFEDITYVYGNKAYFEVNKAEYPSYEQFYQNGKNGKNDLGNSLNLDLSNKYKFKSIESLFEYQDSEYLYISAAVKDYEQLKKLEENFKLAGFTDITINKASATEPLLIYVIGLAVMIIILLFIQLFFFENEHIYNSKSYAVLKLNGFRDNDIYIKYIMSKKNIFFSSLMIATVEFFLLNIDFKFTLLNFTVLCAYWIVTSIAFVCIYLYSLCILRGKVKKINIVATLKNERDTKKTTVFANFLNGVIRIFIIIMIIALLYISPLIVSKMKLAEVWKSVENDVSNNSFAYANLKNEDEIQLLMMNDDAYIQNLNDGMNYFEKNNDGWFIFPNSYYADDYENCSELQKCFENKLVFANYNYLERIKFPNIDQLNSDESYLLIPESESENELEIINNLDQFAQNDSIELSYEVIYYPPSFEFYSYNTKALEQSNGYYQQPFVYISSERNKGPIYTQYFYQNFYYTAEEMTSDPLKEVAEYHETSELFPSTRINSKYAEYSKVLNLIKLVLAVVSGLLFCCIIIYILTTNVLIYSSLKKNEYKNVVKRINGKSLVDVYKNIYVYFLIVNLSAIIMGSILVIVLNLNVTIWLILSIIYICVEFLFLGYQINKIEKNYILKILKEK